jgi:uncharacterized protein YprB with RNaseH-like and TPR domain
MVGDKIRIFFDIETTGINPFDNRVVAIGFKPEGKETQVLIDENEKKLIENFVNRLGPEIELVCFYSKFDVGFLILRGLKHEINLNPLRSCEVVDIAEFINYYISPYRISLRKLAYHLNIEVRDHISGKAIPELWGKRMYEPIIQHCRSDVETLAKIYAKIKATGGQ